MARARYVAVLASMFTGLLGAAERDICEGKQGPELIRCIESAARGPQGSAPPAARSEAPSQRPSPPPRSEAEVQPENCTGRADEALRRCLAAGGRLSPEAAVVSRPPPNQPAGLARPANCDGLAGENLRRCVEAQAQAPQPANAQPQVIPCTGYVAADQPLCLHRNTALMECRNRQKYPDFNVCTRSFMSRAPEPVNADCEKLQARSRAHCEARNRVFRSCTHDKLGYFECLANRLGPDASLTKRAQ